MSAAATAEHLAKELGGKASHWSIWLANDRKPSRVNRGLPQEPGPGRPRYNVAMVDAYITNYIREHSHLNQSGNQPRLPKNRGFAPHISAISLADGADQAAVLFVIPKPLATFILSSDEARQIATRLIKAAEAVDEETNEKGARSTDTK